MQRSIYSDPVHKYLKFRKRLEKAIKSGRFARYTKKKKNMLLHRLSRLKKQIEQLGLQWKLAALGALSLGIWAASGSQAYAQTIGDEFQVNTYTTGSQEQVSLALDDEGDYVVVWRSDDQDGSSGGIYAQVFDADGSLVSGEILVNTYTTNSQRSPDVAMDSDGDFVVVWSSSDGQDGDTGSIHAQRFDKDGAKAGGEILVNTYSTSFQSAPSVAIDPVGNFVVIWQSSGQDGDGSGIYGQRFNSDGSTSGGEFQINNITTGSQEFSSIAMDDGGNFVVAWHTDYYEIKARLFDNTNTPVADEFMVNTYTTGRKVWPSVGMDADGDFVIVWGSEYQDYTIYSVYGQLFDNNGNPRGDEFKVNDYSTSMQRSNAVAMSASGDFVVSWSSYGYDQDGDSYGIYAQRFTRSGAKFEDEFRVNTYTSDSQNWPSMAMNSNGEFIVAWESHSLLADDQSQDGDGHGIFAQRYINAGPSGEEIFVNTYFTGYQVTPSIAMNGDGDFAVVWNDWTQDGYYDGVFGQRFSSIGEKEGSEFQVNTYTTHIQSMPALAMDETGDFVAVWQSYNQDGSQYGIYAQRFLADGSGNGSEFLVNNLTTNSQQTPSVSMNGDGDFVVVWQGTSDEDTDGGIFGRVFDDLGNPIGDEFLVNTYTTGGQFLPDVSLSNNGNFVVAWNGIGGDLDINIIQAQMFQLDGTRLGSEIRVNNFTGGNETGASVDMNSEGSFVISWHGQNDGDQNGVFAQRFDSNGSKQGSEISVNTYTTSSQQNSDIGMSEFGDFTICWESNGQDGYGYGIYAQRFDQFGDKVGSEFRAVNEYIINAQAKPSIATDVDGDCTIAWQSLGWDGSYYGIAAQRFEFDGPPILESIGSMSGNELEELTFSALYSNDEGQVITYSLDPTSLGLGMTIDSSTGAFSWTPGEDEDGSYDVTVTVSDGTLTDEETITLTVNEVNEAPVLDAIGSQSGDETTEITFTASSSDADLPANTLTYSLDATSEGQGMIINSSTGEFSWTPAEDESGSYDVTVTVSDGSLTDEETFTLTVNEVNEAPVLDVIGAQSVDETTEITFTASSSDTDLPANTLTYSLDAASLGLGMTINGSTGIFSWTPGEDEDGSYDVTVTVSDGTLTDEETFALTVNEVNEAPVLDAIGAQSGDETTEITFTASSSDVDLPANTLTYSLDATSLGLGMAIDGSTGAFSWTPGEDEDGSYDVTVTVSDGSLADEETIILTVTEVNEAPVLDAIGAQSGDETTEITFTASSSDVDLPANTLTYSLDATSLGLGMTIDGSTGLFSWTPAEDQDGSHDVTVEVSDGMLTDEETIAVTVNEINVAPILLPIGNQEGDIGSTIAFTVSATDEDLPANTLTFSIDAESESLGMTINASTGDFNWTPSEDHLGYQEVMITVSDGQLSDSEFITIIVNSIAPIMEPIADYELNNDEELAFTVEASGGNGALSFSLDASSLDKDMTISPASGEFRWIPRAWHFGSHDVTVTVTDGINEDSDTFTVIVNLLLDIDESAAGINIYPNPVQSSIQISLKNLSDYDHYKLMDISGKTMFKGIIVRKDFEVAVEGLPSGTYLLELKGSSKTHIERIIKK